MSPYGDIINVARHLFFEDPARRRMEIDSGGG